MATLIALLISLLGYGTPSDYENHTEQELQQEISVAQQNSDGGNGNSWDYPSATTNTGE